MISLRSHAIFRLLLTVLGFCWHVAAAVPALPFGMRMYREDEEDKDAAAAKKTIVRHLFPLGAIVSQHGV